MIACKTPCFAFWRIACLVLSFARQNGELLAAPTLLHARQRQMLTRIKYAGKFFYTSTPKQNCSFDRMTALLRPRLPLNVHFVVIQTHFPYYF